MLRKETEIVPKEELLLDKFKNSRIKKSLFALSITILVLSLLLITPFANLVEGMMYDTLPSGLVVNEQSHHETFVEIDCLSNLDLGFFTKGSVIHVNYTVLACSNASVSLRYIYASRNYTVWAPVPDDLVLAPGESFAGNFTLITAITSGVAIYGYDAWVVTGGTNATVHYWSEILVTGKTSATGFLILSGSLIFLSLCIAIYTKRKAVRIKH